MDRRIAEAYSIGAPLVEKMPEWKERFRGLHAAISGILGDVKGVNQ